MRVSHRFSILALGVAAVGLVTGVVKVYNPSDKTKELAINYATTSVSHGAAPSIFFSSSSSSLPSTVLGQKCLSENGLPDSNCTPGIIDVTKTKEILCAKGYTTKSVRPPVSYTNKLKIWQIKEYGYADTSPSHYEEDHLVSLELGGDPMSALNLWPEPGASPNPKDAVENRLHKEVCAGSITLQKAQGCIAKNWKTCP